MVKEVDSISYRQLRKHIQKALTGICLGAGLVAVPVYADTFMVTNTNDSGPGSLRQAILDANATPISSGYHIIESDPSLDGAVLILDSPLPAIEGAMDIDVDFVGSQSSHIITPITVTGNGNLYTNILVDGVLTANDNAQVNWSNSGVGALANRESTIATFNDHSSVTFESMSLAGDVIVNDNATLNWDHGTIWRQFITNDNAVVATSFVNIVRGNLVANGNSVVSFGQGQIQPVDPAEYEYAVIANDNAQVKFVGSASQGNIQANDNSLLWLSSSASVVGDAFANDRATLYLQGSTINLNTTVNDSAVLRSSGENYINGTTTFGENATFAPDVTHQQLIGNHLIINNAKLQPWFDGTNIPNVIAVGESNAIPVLEYDTVTGTFDPKVLSPLDFAITSDSYSSGAVKLYLNSNQINLTKMPGSENAHAIGGYLSRYFNSTQTPGADLDFSALQTSGAPARLNDITLNAVIDASQSGNLNQLDQLGWDIYSTHNAQTYWNQKSFVDSIAANLHDNPLYQDSGTAAENPLFKGFARNAGATGAQLVSLRQAMTSSARGLGYAVNENSSNSNELWATYNGNHQSTDADSSVGSRDWSSSTDGYTVGFTNGGDKFSWGVAAGHQDSDLNFAGGNGEQEGWNMGLYGSLKGKSTFLTGIIGYGKYDNDLYGADVSNFNTKATSVSLEIGKHLGHDKNNEFTPYASVLWTKIKQDNASGDEGLILKNGSNNIFTTELGLRYNHRMFDKNDSLKGGWLAGLSWLHQGGDTGLPVNVGFAGVDGSAAVKSTPLAGNSVRVQLGAYGRIHNNLIGFAAYQGTFGSSQKINAVNAGIGYQF